MLIEVGARKLIGENYSTQLICLSEGPTKIEGMDLIVEICLSIAVANNRQTIVGNILELDLLISV